MKVFELTWSGSKTELLRGKSISDAFNNAGYSPGALRALDSWKEVKELLLSEKFLLITINGATSDLVNPIFVEEIRKHTSLIVGDTVNINYGRRQFSLRVKKISGVSIEFTQKGCLTA